MSENALHPNIQTYVSIAEVGRDVAIDTLDLSSSMAEQMGFVVRYGELLAQAKRQVELSKQRLELVEAQTIKDMRSIYIAKGDKSPSETRLEKEVRLAPDYIDAQRQLADARYVANRLEAVVQAFDHRRSMLNQTARGESQARLGNPILQE